MLHNNAAHGARLLAGDDEATDAILTETGRRVRVLVLDEEELTHFGMRLLLARQPWVERCLSATEAQTALALAVRFDVHVALVDVSTAERQGRAVFHRLRAASPRLRVLLLTPADSLPAASVRACGAFGFASRTWSVREIARAIRMVSMGMQIMPKPTGTALGHLSARQQEILARIACGETNAEIAERLCLSPHTVKQHASALYRKLNVRNRTHALEAAHRLGLLEAA